MTAGSVVARKRKIECRTKVKTGCATCRSVIADRSHLRSIPQDWKLGREVKCDEIKPSCRRCASTGRTCDGYESPFRISTRQSINHAHSGSIKSDVGITPIRATLMEISPQDISLLNCYFSTKTLFDVKLSCDEEARQVLQASLTDPTIRHAVLSLKALREDLETLGDGPASVMHHTPSHHYGLQQYNMALGYLASNLASPSSNVLKSALLCCQVFISIEQVRKNYAAMAQHIIRGLGIMHEYRARPNFVAANKLLLAHHEQLPFLDVFIIKLFVAPCKFAEPPETADISGRAFPASLNTPHQRPGESSAPRIIAPDKRTELTRIAASTLDFLDKVSRVESVEIALRLLPVRAALLDSLESWLIDLQLVQTVVGYPNPEPVSMSFLRLFRLILKIVLLGTLGSSPDLHTQLQAENDRLQGIANGLGERLKAYKMCNGTSNERGEHTPQRAMIHGKVV